jgi:inosine/xanthosine triphosphate pyrophosphatase family protein
VEGEIATAAAGACGFHWHPVFLPSGATRTLGEMTPAERASFGGAAEAVMGLRRHLGL